MSSAATPPATRTNPLDRPGPVITEMIRKITAAMHTA